MWQPIKTSSNSPNLYFFYPSPQGHINKSFVLTYETIENEKSVRVLDYDHHNKIYD